MLRPNGLRQGRVGTQRFVWVLLGFVVVQLRSHSVLKPQQQIRKSAFPSNTSQGLLVCHRKDLCLPPSHPQLPGPHAGPMVSGDLKGFCQDHMSSRSSLTPSLHNPSSSELSRDALQGRRHRGYKLGRAIGTQGLPFWRTRLLMAVCSFM